MTSTPRLARRRPAPTTASADPAGRCMRSALAPPARSVRIAMTKRPGPPAAQGPERQVPRGNSRRDRPVPHRAGPASDGAGRWGRDGHAERHLPGGGLQARDGHRHQRGDVPPGAEAPAAARPPPSRQHRAALRDSALRKPQGARGAGRPEVRHDGGWAPGQRSSTHTPRPIRTETTLLFYC
eukprot:scaffold61_cov101-Isochrysis_galbana.AAC.1